MSAVWRGAPAKAPSRSTTCSRAAPSAVHLSAIATGSSENTVSRSLRPSRSRTQRPSRRSTAGMTITAADRAGRADHRREVLEQPEPPPLALLGMELRRADATELDGRREPHPVLAPRRARVGTPHERVIGVHEVKVRVLGDPLEQAQPSLVADLVPSHVGDLAPGRESGARRRGSRRAPAPRRTPRSSRTAAGSRGRCRGRAACRRARGGAGPAAPGARDSPSRRGRRRRRAGRPRRRRRRHPPVASPPRPTRAARRPSPRCRDCRARSR